MKKVFIIGTIFIMLAVFVVPAAAKSPFKDNGHGNSGKGNTPLVTPAASNTASDQGQNNQQNKGNHGNHGNHGGNGQANKGNGNGNGAKNGAPFYLQGTIKSIDMTTETITVTLTHGSSPVKQFIGGDLILHTTDATQYFKINQMDENGGEASNSTAPAQGSSTDNENGEHEGSNRVPITFEQLAVGDIVAIHGNLMDGVYTARLVTVYVRAPEGQPEGAPPTASDNG